jgi:hypothetical protein
MNEYFGKRGMTVSVEVFITKPCTTYQKHVYFVALDRCDQNSLETLCIADIVLDQFQKDFPSIKQIELKSDNAGNIATFIFVRSILYIYNHFVIRKLSRERYTRVYVFDNGKAWHYS